MSTLQALGNLVTIAGLLLTIGAAIVEARAHHLVVVNGPAVVRQVRRFLHLPVDAHLVAGTATATAHAFGLVVTGFRQEPIDPEAPVADQIAALQKNIDHTREHVLEVMKEHREQDRERIDKRLADHKEKLAELRRDHERARADEHRIATDVARWEFVGLGVALVGALLATVGSLG